MHKIDLLKGQGIPVKTTFAGTIIIAITVIVPIIVGAVMLDRYLQNREIIDSRELKIFQFNDRIAEYAPDVKLYNSSLSRRAVLTDKLNEVSRCVDTFVQWSPILVTVAQDLPDEMIMNVFSTQSIIDRPAVRGDNDPNKLLQIPIPERTMLLEVSGRGEGNFDSVAKDYLNALESSDTVGRKKNRVDFSREPGRFGDEQTVSYKMNFIFNTQLQ